MSFIVATNVVASWPPERRLTGTPHARANFSYQFMYVANRIEYYSFHHIPYNDTKAKHFTIVWHGMEKSLNTGWIKEINHFLLSIV